MAWIFVLITIDISLSEMVVMYVRGMSDGGSGLAVREIAGQVEFEGRSMERPVMASVLLSLIWSKSSLRTMGISRGASIPILTTSPSIRVIRISIESPITMDSSGFP